MIFIWKKKFSMKIRLTMSMHLDCGFHDQGKLEELKRGLKDAGPQMGC
jgi:hypothetical protein